MDKSERVRRVARSFRAMIEENNCRNMSFAFLPASPQRLNLNTCVSDDSRDMDSNLRLSNTQLLDDVHTHVPQSVQATEKTKHTTMPIANVPKPHTLLDRLQDLPAEIRFMVYNYLFEGATLDIKPSLTQTIRGNSTYADISVEDILVMISGHRGALLIVSDFCKQEAVASLAENTLLRYDHEVFLMLLDRKFSQHVTTIKIDLLTFLRTDKKLLPNLKKAVIYALADESYDVIEVIEDFLYDIIRMPKGRDVTQALYKVFAFSTGDWRWKREQLIHLSNESSWELVFTLYQPFFNPAIWQPFKLDDADPMDGRHCELDYNLKTKKCVSVRLMDKDRVMMEREDFKDWTVAKRLGLVDELGIDMFMFDEISSED